MSLYDTYYVGVMNNSGEYVFGPPLTRDQALSLRQSEINRGRTVLTFNLAALTGLCPEKAEQME